MQTLHFNKHVHATQIMRKTRNVVKHDKLPKCYFPSVGKFQDIFFVYVFFFFSHLQKWQ